MKSSYAVHGIRETQTAFTDLTTSVRTQVVRAALRESAKPVQETARRLAPKDTGRGARGISIDVRVQDGFMRAFIGASKKAWYLGFHETGTSKMGARPFLRPALEENAGKIRDEFVVQINAAIAKVQTARVVKLALRR